MSDAPERIWAYAGTFKMWRDHKTDAPHKQTEYVRADINAELLEALEAINKPKYGLQGIIEDGDSAEERAEYYVGLVRRYEEIARAAIARAKGGTQ